MSEDFCSVTLYRESANDAIEIDVFRLDDEFVLLLAGEADCATAWVLEQALAVATQHDTAPIVTLDLTGISFLSAECIGLICASESCLRGQARRLVVRGPSRVVGRVLELCGLGAVIATSVPSLRSTRDATPDAA